MYSLENKVAYITGGARGIGKAIALSLAKAGANIAILDLDEKMAIEVCQEIEKKHKVQTKAILCDVTDEKSAQNAISLIEKTFNGRIDIAVNNAGICINEYAQETTLENWNKVINVNLTGVFIMCKSVSKVMIKQKKGSIINIASMSAHVVNDPQPQAAYNASKAGVIQLTKSLAVEWASSNIRVNSISPGYINTELTKLIRKDWSDKWVEKSNMKRLGEPEELTSMALYLSHDSSSFTTGADMVIDGGYTCL